MAQAKEAGKGALKHIYLKAGNKKMLNSFTTLLNGLPEMNGDLCVKMKQASVRQRASFEARFEARKEAVRIKHEDIPTLRTSRV